MTWIRDRALTLALVAMFLVFLVGQLFTGFAEYNDEQAQHGQAAVAMADYLATGHPWEALFENWESEFLQMSAYVVLTAILFQRGSAESRDPDDPKTPKTLAKFSGPDGAWGEVLRGTHGLTPDKLDGYLKMRVAEYSKGFNWLPKDSHLQWLKKDIVTVDGRKWADWRYVPMLKGTKDYSHSPVYTRLLTTSYKGQL